MKIAIIGWGSVVWNPRDLPFTGTWQESKLELPIEFSRKSKDGRLTLVVDFKHGTRVVAYVATSTRKYLEDAVADLRDREKTILARIGFYNKSTQERSQIRDRDRQEEQDAHTKVAKLVKEWIGDTEYDAAVWTALASNYESKFNQEFSVEHAIDYLHGLNGDAKLIAHDYILRAPATVQTKLRTSWNPVPN